MAASPPVWTWRRSKHYWRPPARKPLWNGNCAPTTSTRWQSCAARRPRISACAEGSLQKYLPAIPTGVPSDVLERRPDIAREERLMAAANAQIGVAKSAYYPSLQLAATAGLESTGIGNLFSLPSSLWAIGATLAQPLFSGGRIRAGVDFAKAGYQDSVAQYRQTVLVAFQEVEDALAGLAGVRGRGEVAGVGRRRLAARAEYRV